MYVNKPYIGVFGSYSYYVLGLPKARLLDAQPVDGP